MARTLLAVEASLIYDQRSTLPSDVLRDRAQASALLVPPPDVPSLPDYQDEIIGTLDRTIIPGIIDYYRIFASIASGLGACALNTARRDNENIGLAVTSRHLPDRLARLMAAGLRKTGCHARGFGYVTSRQQRGDPDAQKGFDPRRVRAAAEEDGYDRLVSVGLLYELRREGSVAALADHRVIDGPPVLSDEPDTSYCFYQQRRGGNSWVRSIDGKVIIYGRTSRDAAPANIIIDALDEPRLRP